MSHSIIFVLLYGWFVWSIVLSIDFQHFIMIFSVNDCNWNQKFLFDFGT